jgi:hypothetical protein
MVAATYRPPTTPYQVVLRFTTGSEPTTDLSPDYDRYYAWLASEYIANGLADLARTGRFAEAVANRLAQQELDVPPQAIQAAISTDNAQSVLVAYITWSDPAELAMLAQAFSDEIILAGPTYYPQMDGVGTVAQLADTPAPVALPPSLRAQLVGPGLRLLLAAATGVGLMLAAHFVDPWVRDDTALTSLEIPIAGTIPRRHRSSAPRD